MTGPRTHALRFRIAMFARQHEWSVTARQIAEAIGETETRIRSCINKTPGWPERIRATVVEKGPDSKWGAAAANAIAARHIAADIVAGKIGNGEGW